MNFVISELVADFYKQELEVATNESVRLFVQGAEGFFLGVQKDECCNEDYKLNVNGVTFFIKENDLWHFNGKKLDMSKEQLVLS
ncbi:MAG: hypothetical protein LRY71_05045 [Bacillaceae bacterium]|nr:hypothetical protein [Bacillaceae bacterium]